MGNLQEKTIESLADCFPEEAAKGFLHAAIRERKHLAMWSMPESGSYEVCIDLSSHLNQFSKISFRDFEQGFVIAPYTFPDEEKAYFLKGDLYWNSGKEQIIDRKNTEESHRISKSILSIPNRNSEIHLPGDDIPVEHEDTYKNDVADAVKYIEKNDDFSKVVLSRSEVIPTNAILHLHNLFIDSIQKYPYSFNYIIYSPEIGLWFGATPEVLISQDHQNMFETMALAGTQPFSGGSLKDATWTQKEIEEQALVSRFIINCFKKIRLREFTESGPKTSMAGNLMHLRTDFNVDLNEVDFPELSNVMLDLLHPTSAVCGMPKEQARKYIKQAEQHDRELYSGFLGPVHADYGTSIFVNLRCARIYQECAKLFAGAGITLDSNPEKEHRETELKFRTIRDLLL